MLGISWFWFYGATFLAQFAGFARDVLGGDEHVVTLLLALFSVGIGVGSLLCERLSGRKVELGPGAVRLDRPDAVRGRPVVGEPGPARRTAPAALALFLAEPRALARRRRPGADRPVRRLLHRAAVRADPGAQRRRRTARGSSPPTTSSTRCSWSRRRCWRSALLAAGLTIPELFLVTGLMNAAVALFIYGLVPEFLMRFLAWMLVHTFYRVRKDGLEHLPDDGPCVIVCNHVSYVDAVVIAATRPAADPLRHGPPDLPGAAAVVHLPHHAHDPDRAGEGGSGDEGPRVRQRAARRSRPARSSASSPRASSPTRAR